MKIRIDSAALLLPLYRAQGALAADAAQVMACVHIAASGGERDPLGGIVVCAGDIDAMMTLNAQCDVIAPGVALVPGKALYSVVKALPPGSVVTLSSDEVTNRMTIEAGRSRYHLNGMAPAEFPLSLFASKADDRHLLCDKSALAGMLSRVMFSVSGETSRPALCGVLIEVKPAGDGQAILSAVTTDGHRLSKVERQVVTADFDRVARKALLHSHGADLLQRICEGADPSVGVSFAGRDIVFASDNARLRVRQIDETFPDYARVIPDDRGDVVLSMPVADLTSAMRRVMALSAGKDVTLKMLASEGTVAMSMSHGFMGDALEEVEAPACTVKRGAIGFNPRYLLDACRALGTDTVQIEASDEFSPCVVTSDEDPGAIYIVMPMRL
mgnify:CR=1 FL=1